MRYADPSSSNMMDKRSVVVGPFVFTTMAVAARVSGVGHALRGFATGHRRQFEPEPADRGFQIMTANLTQCSVSRRSLLPAVSPVICAMSRHGNGGRGGNVLTAPSEWFTFRRPTAAAGQRRVLRELPYALLLRPRPAGAPTRPHRTADRIGAEDSCPDGDAGRGLGPPGHREIVLFYEFNDEEKESWGTEAVFERSDPRVRRPSEPDYAERPHKTGVRESGKPRLRPGTERVVGLDFNWSRGVERRGTSAPSPRSPSAPRPTRRQAPTPPPMRMLRCCGYLKGGSRHGHSTAACGVGRGEQTTCW